MVVRFYYKNEKKVKGFQILKKDFRLEEEEEEEEEEEDLTFNLDQPSSSIRTKSKSVKKSKVLKRKKTLNIKLLRS